MARVFRCDKCKEHFNMHDLKEMTIEDHSQLNSFDKESRDFCFECMQQINIFIEGNK